VVDGGAGAVGGFTTVTSRGGCGFGE